jgi:uncharacterized lipoprotein YbaY
VRVLILLAAAALTLGACSNGDDDRLSVTGTVILSSQTIELSDTVFPIAFELGDIAENNTYSVAARAEAAGELVMISDTIVTVITNGAPTSAVEVALVTVATN